MARRFHPVHLGSPRFATAEHGPFLVTEAWFPPGLGLPPHQHERTVVAITLEGGWSSSMLRRPYACEPGTLLVEPAGETHSNLFGVCGGHVLVVQPDAAVFAGIERAARALARPQAVPSGPAALIARQLRRELDAPDALSPLAVDAFGLELLLLAARGGSTIERTPPAWLDRAIEYLHEHARTRVSLSSVAAAAGVHPAHLARTFRLHRGTSVAAYARGLRLAWAAARLAEPDRSIAEIAAEAGFADQSHFTRAFHRHTGRTPQAFRRRPPSTA